MKSGLFSGAGKKALRAVLLILSMTMAIYCAQFEPKWESLDKRKIPEWYLDAKFGIFIHWGIYSVPSWGAPKSYAEWYWHNIANKKEDNPWWQHHKKFYGEKFEYQDFAPMFKAEYFNPEQWAELFYRAGAKYVVPTSKHHDGFCLFESKEADKTWGRAWNAVSTGPKRDLLGELSAAVRKRGIKFGFYYSMYEWFNPLWLTDRQRYINEHMTPQFKDVVTRYKPSIIFSDGEWDLPSSMWKSEQLLAWLYNESPVKDEVVVNDRWGKETRHKHGDYFTTEYGAGLKDAAHPWEENRGMGYSYGYNRAENIDDYKTAKELIIILCDLVSRGGNLLLNIGPTGDGRIPVIMQDRLLEIGKWLNVNGEAIYGTRYAGRDCQWSEGKRPSQEYGEFKVKYDVMDVIGFEPKGDKAVKQMFFTKKGDTIYAITPYYPPQNMIIKKIKTSAETEISLLGYNEKLKYKTDGTNLQIEIPHLSGDKLLCQHAYAFKITKATLLPDNE